MILLSCQVSEDLADMLEQYFCGLEHSPWMLMRMEEETHFRLSGYFDNHPQAEKDWRKLRSRFGVLPEITEKKEIEEESWINRYRESFKPWSCRGLHWIPLWMRNSVDAPIGEAVIFIEPGLAFGTGDHPTTRLCTYRLLDFIDSRNGEIKDCSVIDAGTGSGILALSAARLGFGSVFGFDIDPNAIQVCARNLILNQLEGQVECQQGGVEDCLKGKRVDLVLSNIESDILCRNSSELLEAIKPGGVLVLGGIFSREIDSVFGHFLESGEKLGVRFTFDCRAEGDWWDLAVRSLV